MIARIQTLVLLAVYSSTCFAQRTLKWNVTWNNSFSNSRFDAMNAPAINFACSDQQIYSYVNTAMKDYTQGDDGQAQNTYQLAMCSYLRPNTTAGVVARIMAISNLQVVIWMYTPFNNVNMGYPFLRYCYTYDLLKPDLNLTMQLTFTAFVRTLIHNATSWLNVVKSHPLRDNFASNVASMMGICAQAIQSSTLVAETQSVYIASLLSPDQNLANIYQNGTTYDFFVRDALDYDVATVLSFIELALRMPDGFFTADQWQLIERGIYFVKQFYLPACLPNCVYHREFMTTQYPPDQTSLHVALYGTIWPSGGYSGDFFMYMARIPFLSVRAWTSPLAQLVRAAIRPRTRARGSRP